MILIQVERGGGEGGATVRRGGGRKDQRRNRGKGQGRGTEDLDQGRTICLENTPAENP